MAEIKENISFLETLKEGILSGIKTIWMLTKVIVPVYFIVTFLGKTPVLDSLAVVFEPIMAWFGLPGEAALALVLGNVMNLYAAIGVMGTLALTTKQITTIAIMFSFSHSLLIETAVIRKTGVKGYMIVLMRITLAILSGLFANIVL